MSGDVMLAVDLGAGSGRIVAAGFDGDTLNIKVLRRFPTRRISMAGRVYWDFPAIFSETINGIRDAVKAGMRPVSIGIDSWGVDYGLVDFNGELCAMPRSYRDPTFNGLAEKYFKIHDIDRYYSSTGIDPMDINTLFQLWERRLTHDPKPGIAKRMLFIPDLLAYFLNGVQTQEYTIASTSGMIDAEKCDWQREITASTGLPYVLFQDITMPGTPTGTILPEIAVATGAPESMQVIAVCGHDTQSAIASLPQAAPGSTRAFLSSGTWSLLGAEIDSPVLTPEARKAGFSNEGGPGGRINFLQNITGLWIIQSLRQQWAEKGNDLDFAEISRLAEISDYPHAINPDAAEFRNPADMQLAIESHCRKEGLKIPTSPGEFAMAAMRGLAARYAKGIERLNSFLPDPVDSLHIIGGGVRNDLLTELTRQAVGIPVISGEAEASVTGNILMQAKALGLISGNDCKTTFSE